MNNIVSRYFLPDNPCAEKLHAYTAPHAIRLRVKDVVDLMLLIDQGLEPSPLLRDLRALRQAPPTSGPTDAP